LEIRVDFTGIAKTITKKLQETISIPFGGTCADVVKLLAQEYPDLIGIIINDEGTQLLNSNVFFINGEDMVLPDQMDLCLSENDRLTLLSVIVGGGRFEK
jgi:hypothetical protein